MTDEELVKRLRDDVNGEHDMTPHGADVLQAADRIEALRAERDEAECEKDRLAEINRNLCNSHNILLVDGSKWQTRAETAEAKLAKTVEALDSVMVGGNHLATILPDNFPPAETEPLIALETVGYGYGYEVWCCWRSIMLARTTLAELTGGKDE